MKTIIIIAALSFGLLSSNTYAGHEITNKKEAKKEVTYNVNKLQAKVVGSSLFFNLTMDFESENCIYSLVRYNEDGSMTSIGLKDGFKNTSNIALLYSFKDSEVPCSNVQYELYRIGTTSETIAKWEYSNSTKKIESISLKKMLSENSNQ